MNIGNFSVLVAMVYIIFVVIFSIYQKRKIDNLLKDLERKIKTPDENQSKILVSTGEHWVEIDESMKVLSTEEMDKKIQGEVDTLINQSEDNNKEEIIQTHPAKLNFEDIRDKDFGDVAFNDLTYTIVIKNELPNVYFYPIILEPYLEEYARNQFDSNSRWSDKSQYFIKFIKEFNIKYNANKKILVDTKNSFYGHVMNIQPSQLTSAQKTEAYFSSSPFQAMIDGAKMTISYIDPESKGKSFDIDNPRMFKSYKLKFGYDIPNYEYFLEWYNGEIDAERKKLESSFELIPIE